VLRNCRCYSTFSKDELKSSSMFSMEEEIFDIIEETRKI
jgi:hypothetical protein